MRLRTSLHTDRSDAADLAHPRFVDATVPGPEADAPAYVWPLNPWGGVPFRRAQA